jgi:hypothetical protein
LSQPASRVWAAVGLGGAGGAGDEGGVVLGQMVLLRRPHYLSARAVGILDPYDPASCSWGDLGLLYGRAAVGRAGHAVIGTGLAATKPPGCRTGGNGSWTVGIPLLAEAALRLLPVLGLGLQLFANLNPGAGYGGAIAFVQMGWLPR